MLFGNQNSEFSPKAHLCLVGSKSVSCFVVLLLIIINCVSSIVVIRFVENESEYATVWNVTRTVWSRVCPVLTGTWPGLPRSECHGFGLWSLSHRWVTDPHFLPRAQCIGTLCFSHQELSLSRYYLGDGLFSAQQWYWHWHGSGCCATVRECQEHQHCWGLKCSVW